MSTPDVFEPVHKLARVQRHHLVIEAHKRLDPDTLLSARCGYTVQRSSGALPETVTQWHHEVTCEACLSEPAAAMEAT